MLSHIAKLVVILALAAVTSIPPTASNAQPVGSESQSLESVVRAPEVKLRKLHLVRPDLIPFPIFFETYA